MKKRKYALIGVSLLALGGAVAGTIHSIFSSKKKPPYQMGTNFLLESKSGKAPWRE